MTWRATSRLCVMTNVAMERPSIVAAFWNSCLSAAVTRATNRWLFGSFFIIVGMHQMYASVVHIARADFHVPRLHRRPACRAARYRVVRGVGLDDRVGVGGNLRLWRHAGSRDDIGGGAGVAVAPGVAAVESRVAAGSHHARSEEHTSGVQSRQYLVCR